jgi:hypothetical protein
LAAIAESQKRARLALFLATLASAAVLAAEWNSYLSWDRQWAELQQATAPAPWAREQLLRQQITSWLETNAINVTVVGLRVSVSDAAVLGSIILLVAAFYLRMTSKRENLVIASALREALLGSNVERKYVSIYIEAAAVFDRADEREGPVVDLYLPPELRTPLVSSTHGFLIYLPALTILAIVLTDIYYALGYISPWRANDVLGVYDLPLQYQIQLFAMDVFALIYGSIALVFCRSAHNYQLGTRQIVAQFRSGLEPIVVGRRSPMTMARIVTAVILVRALAAALLSLFGWARQATKHRPTRRYL